LAAGFGSDAVLAGVAGVLVFCVAWSTLPARSRPVSFAPTFASAIYAGFPLSLVVLVRSWTGPAIVLPLLPGSPTVTSGVAWVLLTLTVTWATDSGAYLVGRAVGRRPFWPRLSPKKTWEGTIAGLLAGALVGMVWSAGFQWSGLTGGALGACGALAAVVGDLTESGLKRQAGAKESGTLLPGHGGLLDRLDSLAFSTVVVFFTGTLNQSAHFLR
jgi:phosphatidate cytidylyltransferase